MSQKNNQVWCLKIEKYQAMKWSFSAFLPIRPVLSPIQMHMKPVKHRQWGMSWVYMHRGSDRASDQTDADTPHSHCCRRTKDTQLVTYSLICHQNETRWKNRKKENDKRLSFILLTDKCAVTYRGSRRQALESHGWKELITYIHSILNSCEHI